MISDPLSFVPVITLNLTNTGSICNLLCCLGLDGDIKLKLIFTSIIDAIRLVGTF